jgi:hypothetical protein
LVPSLQFAPDGEMHYFWQEKIITMIPFQADGEDISGFLVYF